MINFQHMSAATEAEALSLAGSDGTASFIAGGTDMLVLMKAGIAQPRTLIDIKSLTALKELNLAGGGLRIGALVTLAELEESPLVRDGFTALAEAASVAASPQLRNMGTVGGNLLQRPRCWYFRSDYECWLKGGDICYARDGENHHHAILGSGPCVAVHPSDLAPVLVALDASVEIGTAAGGRTAHIEEFLGDPTPDRRLEHDLRPGELITAISIPAQPDGMRSTYLKAMERGAWAFALVSVAARLAVSDGVVTDARLVLGGVATTPWRVVDAERALVGQPLGQAAIEAAAASAVEGARPLRHNGYKVTLARNLVRRALTSLA